MVKTLFRIGVRITSAINARRTGLAELAGAGFLAAWAGAVWGAQGVYAAVGTALLLKAAEWDGDG